MRVSEVRGANSAAISTLLAGCLCLLPFLLPYHQPPILSFQAEWLAAALGIAAALAAVSGRSDLLLPPPTLARWLFAFALLLAAQALAGKPAYPQLPMLAGLYVLYSVLLIWLGAQLAASAGMERTVSLLAACLLAGALANAAAGVIQFYGRPALLEDIVAELHAGLGHAGAYGNIAQSNLYANYLSLGGVALLFLWRRGILRTRYATAAAILLAFACALAGSRSSLLYGLWFALLGLLAGRMKVGAGSRRLNFAAYALAGALLLAQLVVPRLNATFDLGPRSYGAFERLARISIEQSEPRWQAWSLALRVFADAPIFGTGIGAYSGAAFELGISPEMARGEVWSSPHNLPLHLLAETGILGTTLALAGLCIWLWQVARRYFAAPQPETWWIIAAAGIELIHSMFEYPLWSAHFLGVTALVAGLGSSPDRRAGAASRMPRPLMIGMCALLSLALALLLRDYIRLDSVRITGTTLTLTSAEDAGRDAAVMRELARGPLAPTAELWILLGAPLNRDALADKIRISGRVARHFPSNAVVVRRSVVLAFDGQADAARLLLLHALKSFPRLCNSSVSILEQARAADPVAIEPLLALAREASSTDCSLTR